MNVRNLKTIGYHEAFTSNSEDVPNLQKGFDEGFALGITSGLKIGSMTGYINALFSSTSNVEDLEFLKVGNSIIGKGLNELVLFANNDPVTVKEGDGLSSDELEGIPGVDEDDDWLAGSSDAEYSSSDLLRPFDKQISPDADEVLAEKMEASSIVGDGADNNMPRDLLLALAKHIDEKKIQLPPSILNA